MASPPTEPAPPASLSADPPASLSADPPASLSAATTVVGVIGDPVAHSLSPLLHNTAFAHLGLDWVSVGFRVPAGSIEGAMAGARALGVHGLSVTMPHKEAVAARADRRSPLVERLGAANCLVAGEAGGASGGWVAENTDGPGFVASLRRGARFEPAGSSCLVVGAGGAARAVIAALADAGAAEVVVVNRSADRATAAADLAGPVGRVGRDEDVHGCGLVVNATPLGMAGDGDAAPGAGRWPVDPALLGPTQVVVDLVYHPATTPWLAAARQRGAVGLNGLGMLVHQAALQLALWTGYEPPLEGMWQAVGGDGAGTEPGGRA
jgi:shikimate dehydrogenase